MSLAASRSTTCCRARSPSRRPRATSSSSSSARTTSRSARTSASARPTVWLAKLDGKVVTIEAKVGEEGRLFGSVTTLMIEAARSSSSASRSTAARSRPTAHIKDVGPHPIEVAIYREVKAELTVDVVAEGGAVAEAVPETVVAEVEGVDADGEAFVEVVEETAEQADSDVALDEAVEAEPSPTRPPRRPPSSAPRSLAITRITAMPSPQVGGGIAASFGRQAELAGNLWIRWTTRRERRSRRESTDACGHRVRAAR